MVLLKLTQSHPFHKKEMKNPGFFGFQKTVPSSTGWDFSLLLKQDDVIAARHKFIAHCEEATGKKDLNLFDNFNPSSILLIGPEGDFTKAEVEMALQNQFIPVSLGETRLRTETAGVVGATILKLHS